MTGSNVRALLPAMVRAMPVLQVKCSKEELELLRGLASEHGCTQTEVVRRWLRGLRASNGQDNGRDNGRDNGPSNGPSASGALELIELGRQQVALLERLVSLQEGPAAAGAAEPQETALREWLRGIAEGGEPAPPPLGADADESEWREAAGECLRVRGREVNGELIEQVLMYWRRGVS